MPPLPPVTSWKRLFVERASGPWITIAIGLLLALLFVFLTRINATFIQKLTITVLSGAAVWQLAYKRNIDMVTLLLAVLGMFILYSLQRSEVLPVILLMIFAGLLAGLLTLWQGHHQFDKTVLWRHAYLIGFVTAQFSALLTYWIIYDDVLAKAVITTVSLYVWWGLLECAAENRLELRVYRGYIMMALLLIGLVLVTIRPIRG